MFLAHVRERGSPTCSGLRPGLFSLLRLLQLALKLGTEFSLAHLDSKVTQRDEDFAMYHIVS